MTKTRNPSGKQIAAASQRNTVRIWDLVTGESRVIEHSSGLSSVAFNKDGTLLAAADAKGFVKIWDVRTLGEIMTAQGHGRVTSDVGFSPDGVRLLSAGFEAQPEAVDSDSRTRSISSLRSISRMGFTSR